ncbi:MAG: ABC transporter permease [Gemmatimonadota bacterium]
MSAGDSGRDRSVWRRLLRRDAMEEGDEELGFHLEMRMRDYMEDGMSRDEARQAAEKRMGDMAEVRRAMTHVAQAESRRERRREWIGEIRQDLRYAVRTLLRAPAFASVSIVTLAVGIGATVAIFSLVHAVLLAPLPYPQPDRLVRVWETSPQGDARNVVSSGNVVDWQQRARSFTVLGAHGSPYPMTLTGDGEATRVVAGVLQPKVTRALDIAPVLGRSFVERDGVDGNVALISHAIWTTRYGADPDILGRSAVLNEIPYAIVGVMPPEFDFPNDEVDFWLPLEDAALDPNQRTSHNYAVLARLAPGVSVERAQAEMAGIARQIAAEHPSHMTGWSARVVPLHEDITRNVDTLLWLLLGGVLVVLLITCGNLANLLLARAVTRAREMAVRGALGAGRGRILRQLLTESMVLAFFGGLGAVVLAPLLKGLLVSTAPPGVPLLGRAAIDGPVMGFAALTALGSSILFGLAPALRLSRSHIASSLRSGRDAGQSGHARLRGGLLIGQVSLSVMLLVGAGLFVRSFRALQSTELGFEPAGLIVMEVDLPSPRYPEIASQAAFYDRLVERVRALPGIVDATATSQPPGAASGMTFSFAIEGRIATNPSGREDDEALHAVSPGYFGVLGQRIVDGRGFDGRDGADGTPVVILNESLARKHFPDGDAVGHRIAFRVGETPWREIVGVVEDARLASPDVAPDPSIFIPFAQKTWTWLTWSSVVARAAPGIVPVQASSALRSALLELDSQLPPQSIQTVTSAFQANTAGRAFAMTLVTGFGLLALLLSVIGLYGLLSYSVARQSREIGVRIALGAGAADVLGQVLRRSLLLTLVGSLTGVVAAAGASGLIESLLYGVSAVDGATYAATVGLVLVVALGTSALPALRALRTDPLRALRTE